MSFQKLSSVILAPDASLAQCINAINKIFNYINQLMQNFIGKPQFSSSIISSITLVAGSNQVSHTLNGKLTGWEIIRQNSLASIYEDDNPKNNPNPNAYLILISNAPTVISLLVF